MQVCSLAGHCASIIFCFEYYSVYFVDLKKYPVTLIYHHLSSRSHPYITHLTSIHSSVNARPTAIVKGILNLPDDSALNTTLITLNDGEYSTYSGIDGQFSFYGVHPGVHLLDVHSHEFSFSQIKIQLLENAMDAPKCIEYVYPGSHKQAISHPLVLTAHARFVYFEKRPGFSFFSLFKNPMVLMMMFSVGLMVVMPYMMENLDDEQKEQMKKQMELQKDPSKMLSHMWGELSGGMDETAAPKKVKKDKTRRTKRE